MRPSFLFTSLFAVSTVLGETSAERVREKTEHAHLVGHEDALLLKRIEDAIAEWDPRNLTSPYLKEIQTQNGKKFALRRPDLAEFIADPDAAVALGKALFWEMQAGSDFTPRTFRFIRWKQGLLGDLVVLPADVGTSRPQIVLNDLRIVVGGAPPRPLGDLHLEEFGGLESAQKLGDLMVGGEKLRDLELTGEWIVDNKVWKQSLSLSKVVAEGAAPVADLQIKDLQHLIAVGHDLTNISQFTKPTGTACASCHYRFGADARNRNTEAIAFPSWATYAAERIKEPAPAPDSRKESPVFSQRRLPAPFNGVITDSKFSVTAVDPGRRTPPPAPGLLQHEIVGSQGMIYRRYTGVTGGLETSEKIPPTAGISVRADMFASVKPTNPPTNPVVDSEGRNRTRQVTQRNSPSVFNAVFNDRQFHDGRAESTFNGFSIFGDFDKRVVLKKAVLDASGKAVRYEPAAVAIVNASLASQAVGPIVNEVEMSYLGRNFHDIAARMLSRQPLSQQQVSGADSVFAPYVNPSIARGLFDPADRSVVLSYRTLIQSAFRKEWWADEQNISSQESLASRLKSLRANVVSFNGLLPEPGTEGAIRAAVKAILGDSAVLPAQRTVNAIKVELKKARNNADGQPVETPAINALLAAAEEWNLIEGEILPLRMEPVVDRTTVDSELAVTQTGGPGGKTAQDDLMVNNFSLYWGLAIMLYESTLISNDSPFDQMMRGESKGVNDVFAGLAGPKLISPVAAGTGNTAEPPEPATDDTIRRVQLDKLITRNGPPVLTGTAMFQRGFRVFVQNCAECHEPPFFTSAANLDLDPALPDPIAKLHSHSLIRTALADAFKYRLVETGQLPGSGVTEANRHLLGARRFFFDQERIPEVEASVADLMIEFMGIPDRRPLSFNPTTPPPPLDRDPMITWANWITGGGTRPPLGFDPSPQPAEDPLEPYAFYDVGFYNIGVSEPRYDWGIWGFAGSDEALATDRVIAALRAQGLFKTGSKPLLKGLGNGLRTLNNDALNAARLAELEITAQGLAALVARLEAGSLSAADVPAPTQDAVGIPSLGSAYRLPRSRSLAADALRRPEAPPSMEFQKDALDAARGALNPPDHSMERGYLDLEPHEANGPKGTRTEHHFFKRARRMVMTEEPWGHRKPFISDGELMGWGAFKAPSLRNVALTEPYMHNGRFLTLRQVLQFYSFDNTRLIPAHAQLNPDLHPEMGRLALNSDGLITGMPDKPINIPQIHDAESLLFFLHCLTDNRVRLESAPFDHPSIYLVNGVDDDVSARDNVITVKEVGARGRDQSPPQFPSNE